MGALLHFASQHGCFHEPDPAPVSIATAGYLEDRQETTLYVVMSNNIAFANSSRFTYPCLFHRAIATCGIHHPIVPDCDSCRHKGPDATIRRCDLGRPLDPTLVPNRGRRRHCRRLPPKS
jgi:hypothetical protein